MGVSLDPASTTLLTEVLSALKTRNAIELEKMKLEACQKQEELDAAQKAEIEDKKRHDETAPSLYL